MCWQSLRICAAHKYRCIYLSHIQMKGVPQILLRVIATSSRKKLLFLFSFRFSIRFFSFLYVKGDCAPVLSCITTFYCVLTEIEFSCCCCCTVVVAVVVVAVVVACSFLSVQLRLKYQRPEHGLRLYYMHMYYVGVCVCVWMC